MTKFLCICDFVCSFAKPIVFLRVTFIHMKLSLFETGKVRLPWHLFSVSDADDMHSNSVCSDMIQFQKKNGNHMNQGRVMSFQG